MAYAVMGYMGMADVAVAYILTAHVIMAHIVVARTTMAYIFMVYISMACTVVAYIVMACKKIMAYIVMAHIVVAYGETTVGCAVMERHEPCEQACTRLCMWPCMRLHARCVTRSHSSLRHRALLARGHARVHPCSHTRTPCCRGRRPVPVLREGPPPLFRGPYCRVCAL